MMNQEGYQDFQENSSVASAAAGKENQPPVYGQGCENSET